MSPEPTSTPQPDLLNNISTSNILPSNTPSEDSHLRKIPIREASVSLPTLTKRESFLAEKEEEALLPLRPVDEAAARDELLAGADRSGGGRGLRGAAQLHDELGGQLAEVCRPVTQLHGLLWPFCFSLLINTSLIVIRCRISSS